MLHISRLLIFKVFIIFYIITSSLNDLLRPFDAKSSYEQYFHVVICLVFLCFFRFSNKSTLLLFFSISLGVINYSNDFFLYTASIQMFYLVSAFAAFNFGRSLIALNVKGDLKLNKTFNFGWYICIIMLILYFIFYYLGYINRLGHSIPLVLVSSYFYGIKGNLFWLIVPIFSFKRAVLLSFFSGVFFSKRNLKAILYLPIVVFVIINALYFGDDFVKLVSPRWSIVSFLDSFGDYEDINKMTSGRLTQWTEAYNKEFGIFEMLFGSGLGVAYFYEAEGAKWYVHNAYLTIFNIYGTVGIITILALIYTGIKNSAYAPSYIRIYLLYVIISSMLSAKLLVDPAFWVFMGFCSSYRNLNNRKLSNDFSSGT